MTTCAESCRKRYFALNCGGFCSGNGHRLGRCFCGDGATDGGSALSWGRRRDDAECRDHLCAARLPAVRRRRREDGRLFSALVGGDRVHTKCDGGEGGGRAAAAAAKAGGGGGGGGGGRTHRATRVCGERRRRVRSAHRRWSARLPPLRIVAKDCGAGFFALLLYAVNQLIWAEGEAKGRKSRVEFGRRCQDGRPNRYYDGAKGPNVWEYYFEPVSDAGPAGNELVLDAKQQFHLHHMAPESVQTYPHGVHRHLKVPNWVYDEAWHLQVTDRRGTHLLVDHHHLTHRPPLPPLQMRSQASRILTEHVHIRPAILRKAATFYATAILGRSTSSLHHEPTAAERAAGVAAGAADTRPLLGVHVLGTDKIRNVGGRIIKPAEYAFRLSPSGERCIRRA